MQVVWLKGHKNKANRTREVMGYRAAFEDLKQILEQEFKRKESVRDYEVPNWELRQVAVNEYNQALEDLLKLITLDKD